VQVGMASVAGTLGDGRSGMLKRYLEIKGLLPQYGRLLPGPHRHV